MLKKYYQNFPKRKINNKYNKRHSILTKNEKCIILKYTVIFKNISVFGENKSRLLKNY